MEFSYAKPFLKAQQIFIIDYYAVTIYCRLTAILKNNRFNERPVIISQIYKRGRWFSKILCNFLGWRGKIPIFPYKGKYMVWKSSKTHTLTTYFKMYVLFFQNSLDADTFWKVMSVVKPQSYTKIFSISLETIYKIKSLCWNFISDREEYIVTEEVKM